MRHEITLNRENGTVVRLVANYFPNLFATPSIEYFALVKHSDSEREILITENNSSNKSLNGLSVEGYVERGRKGLLSVVRPHEIFKLYAELQKVLRNP